jgi:hypothetical protein
VEVVDVDAVITLSIVAVLSTIALVAPYFEGPNGIPLP